MESRVWSECIQGILSLDLSREIRFRDDRKELFLKLLGLKEGMTVAEIGCGPGALTRKLAKWLGISSNIIGIDRDRNFIDYAREKARKSGLTNINYYEGDALELFLEEESVDACLSYTVIEHVPNRKFLSEQRRICRPGGRVSAMYAVPDKYINTNPRELPNQSQREMELLKRLFERANDIDEKYSVGKYWPDPVLLPKLFEKLGFKNIQIDAVAVPIAIDDGRNFIEESIAIVNAGREQMLEGINRELCLNCAALSKDEAIELIEMVSERFDRRIKYINKGIKIWDYSILIIQKVSGEV